MIQLCLINDVQMNSIFNLECRRQQEEAEAELKEKELQQIKEATTAPLAKKLMDAEEKMAALQAQLEQERRDHELALRLLAESKSGMDDSAPAALPVKSPTTPSAEKSAAGPRKFNLSKWKYAELRDTINTSCDIDLLEACREEFHRRIKVRAGQYMGFQHSDPYL